MVLGYTAPEAGLCSPPWAHVLLCGCTQLVARLTKMGWFDLNDQDESVFRNITDQVQKFLSGGVHHWMMTIKVLMQLVWEMNQPDSVKGLTKHRKVWRLLSIVRACLSTCCFLCGPACRPVHCVHHVATRWHRHSVTSLWDRYLSCPWISLGKSSARRLPSLTLLRYPLPRAVMEMTKAAFGGPLH